MGGEDGCDGSLQILFCVPDTDNVKQKNNSLETIPSRKQRSLLLYVICVQYTKF